MFAAGLRSLLTSEQGLEILGVATTTHEALEMVATARPDVIVVDHDDGEIRQRDFVSLVEEYAGLRVVTVTLDGDDVQLYRRERATQTGIDGLLEAIQRR
jgi:DNA-binding NarL/FixJ family response regulator